jgi:hypothetical protein
MNQVGKNRRATVVHAIPGRVRVRLERSLRSAELLRDLVEALSEVEGVRRVQANPATGSLLLLYDPELLTLDQLLLAADAANIAVVLPGDQSHQPEPDDLTPLARGINSAFGRLNRALFAFTGGKLDVRTVLPLGLAAGSLRQIARSGGNVRAVPWYVLLWYSFEVFTKFNTREESNGARRPGAS